MATIFPNCVFNTVRSIYSPATGVTAQPVLNLLNATGCLIQEPNVDFTYLSEGAMTTTYALCVDQLLDILIGDIVNNLRQIDGITPWPAQTPNDYWRVKYIHYTAPGVLAHKELYVARVVGGGTVG